MKIIDKVNFGLKEIVNAESATLVLKNFGNKQTKINGILIGSKEEIIEETGEIKNTKIGVIKTDKGELISSISPTAIGSMETIISAYKDAEMLGEIEKGIDIMIKSSKSAKGRDFYYLELL